MTPTRFPRPRSAPAARAPSDTGPRPRTDRARRAGRLLLLGSVAALGACSWLEAEFSALDRLPPSAAAPDAALPPPAERP
ncbi:MAG: hypothetical protein AB7O97_13180 [Planctomycetota bacterium]